LKDLPLVMNYLRRACERYIDLKPLLRLLDELEPQTISKWDIRLNNPSPHSSPASRRGCKGERP